MVPTKLDEVARSSQLAPLLTSGSWSMVEGGRDAIKKTFTFKDFNEAFGFMARVAIKVQR